MSGVCSCESCLGKAWERPAGKLQELPWKGVRKGLRGLGGLKASKRQSSLKNRWLGRVAARVALERPGKGLKHCLGCVAARLGKACGKLQEVPWKGPLKRWLGRVAARVALERPAEGFEALSGACSCESCLGKACGKLQELPWKGLRKGLRGLRAGKRQS